MENNKKPGYLFVLPWGVEGIGGVNEVVLNLYDEIIKGGKYRPLILVNKWSCKKPLSQIIDGREIVNLRLRSPYSSERTFLRLLFFFILLPFNTICLYRMLKINNVKVVNPHFPELTSYVFCLLRKLKIYKGKFIISVHGADVKSLEGVAGFRRILWWSMLRGCHAIVACSHALKQEAVSILDIDERRLFVVHNGVSDSFLKSSKKDGKYCFHSQLKSIKYALNVATFEHKKGQDVLIRAFHIISARYSEHKLVLVGRRTEYLEKLKKMVVKLNLEDRVLFFADIPHCYMSQFYKFAQFFVLPSRAEPFGIVLLEAGLYRLPVIASGVGGIGEIIENGTDGMLVQAGSIEELSAQMEHFCLDEKGMGGLGENLYEKVGKQFSWNEACLQYMKLCTWA